MRRTLALFLVLTALLLAGCAHGPPAADDVRAMGPAPYKVLLVFGAPDVETEESLQDFWGRVAGRLEDYHAFSAFEWVSRGRFEDDGRLLEIARSIQADKIVFVWVDPGGVIDLGPNEWSFLSGTLWLGLGIPSFFVGDRSYRSESTVAIQVLELEDNAERTDLIQVPLEDVRLDHLDRGFDLLTLVVPPFLIAGERETWYPLAEHALEEGFFRSLAHFLKTESLTRDGAHFRASIRRTHEDDPSTRVVSIEILSPRVLEQVQLQVDGEDYGRFSGPRLAVLEERVDDGFRYVLELQVSLQDAAPTNLRVIAQSGAMSRTASVVLPQRGEANE